MKSLSSPSVKESVRRFTAKRDDLLHEDEAAFEHHLSSFLSFCRSDPLVRQVVERVRASSDVSADDWWKSLSPNRTVSFPDDPAEDLALRYALLESLEDDTNRILTFGFAVGKSKTDDAIAMLRTILVRPLLSEFSALVSEAADIATPEARALQAVPLHRIPSEDQVRIFLSHKTVDKPLVSRYYRALRELGFSPWLDDPDMPAGTNLERGMLDGFERSCAAVFFITENFVDESYLAAEVEYAVSQKRKKGRKFSIITLRFPGSAPSPGLLEPYVYKNVKSELEGIYEIARALPIELGPVRWKANVSR